MSMSCHVYTVAHLQGKVLLLPRETDTLLALPNFRTERGQNIEQEATNFVLNNFGFNLAVRALILSKVVVSGNPAQSEKAPIVFGELTELTGETRFRRKIPILWEDVEYARAGLTFKHLLVFEEVDAYLTEEAHRT